MRQIILNIPDKKYWAFIELINSLGYVKKIEMENEPTKKEILEGIKEAFEEMKLIKAGKLKGRPINELLDEPLSLADEYRMAVTENAELMKDFASIDIEGWE